MRIAEHGHGAAFAIYNPFYLRTFWTRGTFRGTAAWRSLGGIFLAARRPPQRPSRSPRRPQPACAPPAPRLAARSPRVSGAGDPAAAAPTRRANPQVTGTEAFFADVGHFGMRAVTIAWTFLVYPCLILAYLGQGALLLSYGDLTDPGNPTLCFSVSPDGTVASPGSGVPPYSTYIDFAAGATTPGCAAEGVVGLASGASGPGPIIANIFWYTVGGSFGTGTYKGILAVATLASVVGSQALITGAFTVLSQATSLGLFPFMTVKHTSTMFEHQVFCPELNAILCVLCLFVVATFQHSSNLTAIYGACVATAMTLTTVLWVGTLRFARGWPAWATLALAVPICLMDAALLTANWGKFFVSGPVLLSYPGYTNGDLQTQARGPVLVLRRRAPPRPARLARTGLRV